MDRIKYRSVTEKLNEKKQHRVEPNVKNEIKISEKYIYSEEQYSWCGISRWIFSTNGIYIGFVFFMTFPLLCGVWQPDFDENLIMFSNIFRCTLYALQGNLISVHSCRRGSFCSERRVWVSDRKSFTFFGYLPRNYVKQMKLLIDPIWKFSMLNSNHLITIDGKWKKPYVESTTTTSTIRMTRTTIHIQFHL